MTGINSKTDSWWIITAIRYAYPGLLLLYFVVASTAAICTQQALSPKIKDQRVRRGLILWLMGGIICQYLIHASVLLARSIAHADWVAPPDEVVYLTSSALAWALQFVALLDSKFPIWYPYFGNWIAAVIIETGLLVGSALLERPVDSFDFISISISSLRICNFIVLLCVYFNPIKDEEAHENDDTERQPLLSGEIGSGRSNPEESALNANDCGETDDSSDDGSQKKTVEEEIAEDYWFKRQQEDEEKISKRLKEDGNWWTYCKGFFVFFPYIWPVHSKTLQFRAVLTGACLLIENSLNILVPRQLGQVTDALVAGNGTKAWIAAAIYSALTFANSTACIGWVKFWLWQPIEQYSYDALTAATHAHVMNLSSEFHESRTASDIHQTIFQGKGIRDIVDTVCFSIIPTFVDLFLVFAYLYYLFGPYMALDIAVTTFFYLYSTAKLVSLATNRRRTYHAYYRKEWSSSVSSVSNWRVASYFNQIPYEESQHYSNVKAKLRSQRIYLTLHNIIKVSQTLVMTLGLLVACFMAVYQVTNKMRSPGDFVILLSYWAQLRGPLGIFSNLYKTLSESLMDAERMLEIFQIKPRIFDKDDATNLTISKGDIVFKDVEFAYDDRKDTLNGINLKINGGSTVAIVGETGSGKSTILKLLQRFYDVKGGSIEIDGQDIRNVTLRSLRENIAVVPQDPTLFSETIMANLRYAKLTATKREVHEACKIARIHEKIMSMPEKYNYKVGNTAVKLSGGEQQRLAIARAILKQSAIILLDEATSAVDTETELQIQEALKNLCEGRTTIIVAHRLSTIMRADRIVVMKEGSVIEYGSHDDLIRLKGKYFELWANQIQLVGPDDKADEKSARTGSKSPQKPNTLLEGKDHGSEGPHKDDTELKLTGDRSTDLPQDEAGIINDLDQQSNSLELLKLEELSKNDDGEFFNAENKVQSPRRGLKPEATEFYPRSLLVDTGETQGSATSEVGRQSKEKIQFEMAQKNWRQTARKSYMSLSEKAAGDAGKQAEQLSGTEEPNNGAQQSSSSATMESSQDSAASGTDNKIIRPKLRRPRVSSRRNLSKSDPTGQDDTEDFEDGFGADSGENKPLLGTSHEQNRRASVPSDPLSSQQESGSSFLGHRSRHSRHWRIRKRPISSSGSAPTSATASSVDGSTDETPLLSSPSKSRTRGPPSTDVKFDSSSK